MTMVNFSKQRIVVSNPPKILPLLVYDGDCDFCTEWAKRFRRMSRGRLNCASYQEVRAQFSEIELSAFQGAVQFIDLSGFVSEGAEATFKALATSSFFALPIWLYLHFPGMANLSERAYCLIARNRNLLSFLK